MDRCSHDKREGTGVSLAFPASPTAEDIFRARIFDEPLVPMGAEPTRQENADFAAALVNYAECGGPDDFYALTAFVGAHPGSPWNGALLTNLGLVYYRRGYYSQALQAWEDASAIAKMVMDPAQKPLADRAIGELAYMLAKVGRMSELAALLESVEDRGFCGPATEKIAGARAGLAEMQTRPGVSFRCGPLALHRIMLAVHPEDPRTDLIAASESTTRGFSLLQVEQLSRQLGLNYQMAFREPGADLVVPSVVHFTVDHYAAVMRRDGGRYLLEDRALRRRRPGRQRSHHRVRRLRHPAATSRPRHRKHAAEFLLQGLIDEATIYNRALTPAEIASIYNAGPAGKQPVTAPV